MTESSKSWMGSTMGDGDVKPIMVLPLKKFENFPDKTFKTDVHGRIFRLDPLVNLTHAS